MRYEGPRRKSLPTKLMLLEEQRKQLDREIYLEKNIRSLSNDKLLELYNDVELDKTNYKYHWRFDEQQADPIHKIVLPEEIVIEFDRRMEELIRVKK